MSHSSFSFHSISLPTTSTNKVLCQYQHGFESECPERERSLSASQPASKQAASQPNQATRQPASSAKTASHPTSQPATQPAKQPTKQPAASHKPDVYVNPSELIQTFVYDHGNAFYSCAYIFSSYIHSESRPCAAQSTGNRSNIGVNSKIKKY